jgi:hypothetical protein
MKGKKSNEGRQEGKKQGKRESKKEGKKEEEQKEGRKGKPVREGMKRERGGHEEREG